MAIFLATIPIEPVPKLRPRFTVNRGRVWTRTPDKTRVYERDIAQFVQNKANGLFYEKGQPIDVSLHFAMPIPKSFTKKQRKAIEEHKLHHTVKPDVDNLTKAILDALNGVLWNDDAQIVELRVSKCYCKDNSPYVTICVGESLI